MIRGRMATVTRNGAWIVPPAVVVDTRMSSVTIDFTRAVMQTQVVNISIDDYASSISLIVPEEATVDMNGVEAVGGKRVEQGSFRPTDGPAASGGARQGAIRQCHREASLRYHDPKDVRLLTFQ